MNNGADAARNSPSLALDPTDSRVIAMGARIDFPYSCELDMSGDAGASWVGVTFIETLPPGAESCFAPQVAYDGSGRLYVLFVGLHTAGNVPMGVFLTTSGNRGRTFSKPTRVLGPHAFGVRMAIDITMGDKGRIHLLWLQAGAAPGIGAMPSVPNPILSAHSDDGGATFSKPVSVSPPNRTRAVAPNLSLGPDHRVHALYYDLGEDERDYQGLDGPVWDQPWSLVLAVSDDGGLSFTERGVVDDGVTPAERVQLIFTMPPASLVATASTMVAAWHDARNGDVDVFVRRSTDAGVTWSDAVRLNDDPLDTVTDQYLPVLASAPNGRIDVAFYDRRNDRNNLYNDTYYSYSTDGGVAYSANIRINRTPSHSRVGMRYNRGYTREMVEFGGRAAIISHDHKATVAWTDTRHVDTRLISTTTGPSEQQIYATTIDFATPTGGP